MLKKLIEVTSPTTINIAKQVLSTDHKILGSRTKRQFIKNLSLSVHSPKESKMKIAIDWAYQKDLAVIIDGKAKKFKSSMDSPEFFNFLKKQKDLKIYLEEGCFYEFKERLSKFGDVYCLPGQFTKKARGKKQKSDEKDALIVFCMPEENFIKFEGEAKIISKLRDLISHRDRLMEIKKRNSNWSWTEGIREQLAGRRTTLSLIKTKKTLSTTRPNLLETYKTAEKIYDSGINKIDYQIQKIMANDLHSHALVKNADKVKGFGLVSLAKVICYAKDINRFKSLGAWRHFFGFCVHDGTKKEVTLKRQKTKRNRTLIFQFYESSIKHKNQYRKMFRKLRDEKEMAFKKARNRVMTKICEDLFKMWKFGENYEGGRTI